MQRHLTMNSGKWVHVQAVLLATVAMAFSARAEVCEFDETSLPTPSGPSSYGRDFFIAIPETALGFDIATHLLIGTPSTTGSASYVVENATDVIQLGQVEFQNPDVVNVSYFDSVVEDSNFTFRERGIHIQATGDLPIYVLVTTDVNGVLLGDFLAFPFQDFQENTYEYVAVSTGAHSGFKSQVVLVASEDATEITVSPAVDITLPQDAQDPDSALVVIAAGSSHTLTLNRLQTLLLFTDTAGDDLTGTKIVSNKQLTVISGHQCANVPESRSFCEQLAVQVPPTLTWGTKFLLAPFAGRTAGQYYKVVTAEDSTSVNYTCGASDPSETDLSAAGDSLLFGTDSDTYCYVKSSKPVFVVQLAPGGHPGTGGDNLGDPVMTTVSPIQQYTDSVSFIVSEPQTMISVTVPAEYYQSDLIELDGETLPCTWTEIHSGEEGCSVGYGCTLEVSTGGSRTISHSEGLLSVIVYAFRGAADGLAGIAFNPSLELNNLRESPADSEDELLPFFDLDSIAEVQELERVQESTSDPIPIPGGMPFGNGFVATAYVNENGVISFDDPWKFSHPNNFPTDYNPTQTGFAVAPFWSDNDIRREGTVRYISFEEGDSTVGDDLLELVGEFVQSQVGEVEEEEEEFQGIWMLIAQWDQVHPHPHGADDHEGVPEDFLALTNTYQAVIITDGADSYSLFTYACGTIQWSAIGDAPAVVGINAGGDFFQNHAESGLDTIGNTISCVEASMVQGAKRQVTMMNTATMLLPVNQALQMASRQCRRRYNNDMQLIPDALLQQFASNAEPCPCSRSQVQGDRRFVRTPGSPTCYSQALLNHQLFPTQTIEYGQQCCYDPNGALIMDQSNKDSRLQIIQLDAAFCQACCVARGGVACPLYLSRRPIDDCSNYTPPDYAWGTGDPHYRTLDGRRYDFHADGEYLVLEAGSVQVQGVLQTVQRGSRPAVHGSIAFGEPGNFAYQIWLPGGTSFAVFQTQGAGAPSDITSSLSAVGDTFTDSNWNVVITRLSGLRIGAVFRSGFYLEVAFNFWSYGQVWYGDVRAWVPRTLVASTRGLIGTAPSQDWSVPPADSMFIYANPGVGKRQVNTHTTRSLSIQKRQDDTPGINITIPINQPFPISDLDLNFTDEQIELCANITECLFDLLVTGDEMVALATMNEVVETEEQSVTLNNFPPNMMGDSVFPVTVGEESVYTFTVVDSGDTFTVDVVGGLPEGSVLQDIGGGVYAFHWTPSSAAAISSVAFQAVDSEGVASLLSPQLQVCGCVNGGNCTLIGIVDTTPTVLILNCDCPDAYSGEFCEEDRNGCSEIQCFEGVQCIDVPAPGVGAMCGPCPDGYIGSGEKCSDVDECALDPSPCQHSCNNTIGSFQCICMEGFQLVNGTACEDVNECEGVNDCQQLCTNTKGSFTCACQNGFTLNADGRSCDADVSCLDHMCSHDCAVVDGEQLCFCPTGLALDPSGLLCLDEDECDLFSPCDQTCVNSFGSFECGCDDGYELQEDMRTCEDTDECMEAILNQTALCEENSVCVNTPGSFQCSCVPGYRMVDGECVRCAFICPDGYAVTEDCSACELVDICLADRPCQNGGTCRLTAPPDGYECDCPLGTAPEEDCEAILAFIDGTPALTPNLDGITYTLNIKFSPGDGGRYGCRVTDVRTKVNQRMSCDTLSAEFPNLEAGRSYTVRVMRRRGHIRETIRRRVRVPPA